MNKILSLLFGAMVVAVTAQAQFVQPPSKGQAIVITTNYLLPGVTTTNIPTTAAVICPVGANGVGFGLRLGATNSATTTNLTITLEQTYDGTQWVDDHTFTLSVPQNGTTGYDYFTNMLPTTANLCNSVGLRVKSIQNTNLASVWITNIYWLAR